MDKVICDKCEGTGIQKELRIVWIPGYGCIGGISNKCTKCHGDGRLDWIERIVGKKGLLKYTDKDVQLVEYKDFPWNLIKMK